MKKQRTFALDRVSASFPRRGRSRSPRTFSRRPSRCVQWNTFPKSSRVFRPARESADAARALPRADACLDLTRRRSISPAIITWGSPSRGSRRRNRTATGHATAARRHPRDPIPADATAIPRPRASCVIFPILLLSNPPLN